MAISAAGSSSDAGDEYDVFLNFRGEIRNGFTDFLYHNLNAMGVHVFRDEEKIRKGEVIGEELKRAIKNTKIYIPIFSETYASSKWCLRELKLIIDNVYESKDKKCILPIFFLVESDDVKLKKSLYKADFKKHEEESCDEVEGWKEALKKVTKHNGWVVTKDQSQQGIVDLVVKKVLEELKTKQKSLPEHLVGHNDRVKYLKELLDVGERDVRFIEIYGMGGMGKTTIAKVVFNELCLHFGRYCNFLEDIRERLTKEGIVQLQKELLSNIDGYGSIEINNSEEGMRRIEKTLGSKKVLVILDDVDENVPIRNLIGNFKIHPGSRIIITTRDKDILQRGGFEGYIQQYEMLKMEDDLALQLFSRHAFGRNFPLDDYHELSKEIVLLMEGLPLAIQVVGSSLKEKKDKKYWREMLDRLSKKPEKKIREKLKISYDDLEYSQKQIFLDIACFLFNEKKTDATYIWKRCEFYPQDGIEALTKRCLVKILDNDQFWMHNQLISLGRHIVREESAFKPEEQSRLWDAKVALQIIKTENMKNKIEAIKMDELNDSIEITNEEFKRLQSLRLLKLGNGTYAADFTKHCSKLGWISCRSANWDLMGDNMKLNNLVVFKLHDTSFVDDAKAWDLIKGAQNLKVLSLTQCGGITTIPDLSKYLSLKKLTLAHCNKLKKIENFIGHLTSLVELAIECCKGLTDLPDGVEALVKLKRFSLRGCSGLRDLPCSLGNLTSLIELDLSETGIAKLPDSMKGLLKLKSFLLIDNGREEFPKFIEKLRSFRILGSPKNGSYSPEHHVWQLPSGISMLKILEELDLSGCDEMTSETPIGIGDLSSLRTLNLTSTQICDIPRNIDMLHHLQTLNLRNCNEIQGLSELHSSTINMLHQQASSLPELASFSRLDLKTLVQLPSSLLRFDLVCPSFRWAELLPSTLILRNLMTLEFYYVEVEDIPLDKLPGLESLTIDGCEQLRTLTISSENLRQAHLSFCPDLVDISFSFSEKLESFFVFGCGSLETIKWSDRVKNLEKLEIQQCNELTDVRDLQHLESLKSLEVRKCPSLSRLIDASCIKIPDDCLVKIQGCGDFFKDSIPSDPPGMRLLCYVQKILPDTSNFESKLDKTEGREMATASRTGEESCNQEKTKTEGRKKAIPWWKKVWPWKTSKESCTEEKENEKEKEKDGTEFDILRIDEVSDDVSVGESLIDGTFSTDDFQSESDNTECFEATGNRRQMRDRRIGRVGKTTSMENRKKDKDEIGELANPSDAVGSSCQTCEGVEHYERYCEATTEVEDQRDFSSDGAEFDISGSDEVSDYASVGESLTDGASSIDDFESELDNTECFEATGNRRQMRDERIGLYDSVNGGKTTSMENTKKGKDEIGEPANPSAAVGSSCQTCKGVENYEIPAKLQLKSRIKETFLL